MVLMGVLIVMIKLIKWILLTIISLLPDSPFSQLNEQLRLEQDTIQALNWFLPLDIAGNMLLTWLDCILLYIVYLLVSRLMSKIATIIINGITNSLGFFI